MVKLVINYKLLKDNGLRPKIIEKNKSAIIISTKNNKYVLKENESYIDSIYKYLSSRGFTYFPNFRKINNYMIYDYIEDFSVSNDEKIEDLVFIISLLHLKTTRYSEMSLDDYKKIYETIENKIKHLYNYYRDLNEIIDSSIYMSPSQYLLVRNISIIYNSLDFSKKTLDEWYEIVKENHNQRKVLTYNNFDFNHLLKNNNSYLISFSKTKVDLPVYDLLNIYNNTYKFKDFSELLSIYENKYPLKKDELLLLFIYISLPEKINFKDDEYLNTNLVENILFKLTKSDEVIRPYYNKNLALLKG